MKLALEQNAKSLSKMQSHVPSAAGKDQLIHHSLLCAKFVKDAVKPNKYNAPS
jgi:hypothetical protein